MSMRSSGRASRTGVLIGLLLFGATGVGAQESVAAPVDLPADPALEDFLVVAEARNPGLAAGRSRWQAEVEKVSGAGSFPDPRFRYTWYASEVETRVGPQRHAFSVRQRLPWFGTLGLRRDAVSRGAEAASAAYAQERLRLRFEVTEAWYELYWLGRATAVTEENLALLSHLERVVREKYRVASVEHADLVRVQLELGLLEDRLRSLADRRAPLVARMNALLHRPPGTPVPTPTALPELPAPPIEEAVFAAIEAAPLVAMGDHRVAEAESRRRLARRTRWPDWELGVDWIQTGPAVNPTMPESGKDPLLVRFAVDLPVFRGKHDGPVREADERFVAARSTRDRQVDALAARARNSLFEWRDAARRVDLYRAALVPKAREALEAITTSYRTGKGGFLDLIDAQRTLLEFELELERARTDRGLGSAALEIATGTDWTKGGTP